MNKKDIILFISIFCTLALIAGGTYAYWGWQSNTNKSVVFNTSKGIEDYFVYDAGTSHFVGNFEKSTNYCGGMSNTISFRKKSEVANETLSASIKMDVNYIGNNIKQSNAVKWVLVEGNSSVCSGYIDTGTFNGIEKNTTIDLLDVDNSGKVEADEVIEVETTDKVYTIWIWIDSSLATDALSGETIDVNIWTYVDMTSED